MSTTDGEALVLADTDGNLYVLPRELVELTRVPDENKSAVEAHLGSDTTGFQTIGAGFAFVGNMKLTPNSSWSHFGPSPVGWPYYSPQFNPGGLVENPQG